LRKNWTGVRPVRFREEIFGVLEFIVSHRSVSIEEIRKYAMDLRLKREDRRLKASQKAISLENKTRKKPKLLTKVEQMMRVYRRTGLIEKRGNIIHPTEKSEGLILKRELDEIGGDALFLEYLLNSPYESYWLYLKQLRRKGEIRITSSYSKRNAKLRAYINKSGFFLDIWSFFILRDFFHDFSLLNYMIDESSQVVFPLYEISSVFPEHSLFEYHIKGPDGNLGFWPKPPKDFSEKLVKVYLSLTDNKWNRMVEVVILREKFSYEFATPEHQFDVLLLKAIREEKRFKIVPSVGYIKYPARSTYITKALSLPCNKFGLPYSLIRIAVGGN